MKPHPTQLAVRGNTASSRPHASRLTLKSSPLDSERLPAKVIEDEQSSLRTCPPMDTLNPSNAEPENWATGGETAGAANLVTDLSGRGAQSEIERPLTCEEPAELVRVHPKTIKRMARTRELPGHFRFGRWFFYASELDCWMRTELHSTRHSCR
jgi:Helix-turn-helix domain